MIEELKKLVLKVLPDVNTFRSHNDTFTCYIHNLHLTIKSTGKKFQFSLTLSDPKNRTSDIIHSASCFSSLSELEEGLRAMRGELERRGFLERKLEETAPKVETTPASAKTKIVESNITERTSQLSTTRSSKSVYSQKTRNEPLKKALIPILAVLVINVPLSFLFSRIWVQTILQGAVEERAREIIRQEKR